MCGLAAIFVHGDAPPVDERELLRIREAMAPRGPDGAGLWRSDDGRVGLAHRRLAIVDLSPAGAQPMHWAQGSLAITYNGELYNWRELRAGLESQGVRFRSQSDTEVLLALYAREGAGFVARLRGMFAFALWDGDRQGLLLARDPLGIKPLYFADDGRTLRAASQVKALLAGGALAREPEPAGHVGFFLFGHLPDPFTLWRGLEALPPGGLLWRDRAGVRRWRCGGLEDLLAAAPAGGGALRHAVGESLRRHLLADVPVSLFLSAGRDSACLASLLGAAARDTTAFTLGIEEFRGSAADEVPLAAEVARCLGLRHEVCYLGQAELTRERDHLLAAMDQPTIDGVNVYFVARAAAASGQRVALSGLGADELLGGYPSFRQVPRLVRRLGPLARVPGLGPRIRRLLAPATGRLVSPKYASLLEYARDLPAAFFLRRALYLPWELPAFLPREAVRAGLERLALPARLAAPQARLAGARSRLAALEMAHYMADRLLRDADWAGMAAGLEIRVPFVDRCLIAALAPRLASAAPPQKTELLAGAGLPPAVATRRKTGFVVPVERWLGEAGVRERGLRGWAKLVYRAQAGAQALTR